MFFNALHFTLKFVCVLFLFFFNDTATTEIYTLSLHDALPIYHAFQHEIDAFAPDRRGDAPDHVACDRLLEEDRKSTRLNSSHSQISYAVFCLKKKTKQYITISIDMVVSYPDSNTNASCTTPTE